MNRYWKLILPLLFALAIALGIIQRGKDPYLGFQTKTFKSTKTIAPDKSLSQYYSEAENYGKNLNTGKVNFLAVGDIVLSRKVALAMKNTNDPFLPFSKTSDLLNSADFTFGNLESPSNGTENFNAGETMIFNAPKTFLQGLKKYKFNVLNLANNHALDQGLKGLEFTLNYLDENKIAHMGTGKNINEAWQPAVIEANGLKICFIGASYASQNDGGKTENNFVARTDDFKNLKLKIKNSKSLCDFVIVSMHAGIEYTRYPNQSQIDFAHTAIDAGADMVIGAHPHWIQTIEKYCPQTQQTEKTGVNSPPNIGGVSSEAGRGGISLPLVGSLSVPQAGVREGVSPLPLTETQGETCKYIFYSLGNFIFDQMWSQDTREGLMLKIQISKSNSLNPLAPKAASLDDLQGPKVPAKLESVELIPIIIDNYSTPRPATLDETKKILKKINISETILY